MSTSNAGFAASHSGAAPFVSVVIPTHGRFALLERCLRSLLAQSYPAERYEIIVIEDGDRDQRLTELVTRLTESTGVKITHQISSGSGPAAARNRGWRLAEGSIIAFTDDDVFASPNWLAEGVKMFRDGVAGVAGKTEVPLPAHPTDHQRNVGRLAFSRFVTCNVFYRKDCLERVGGFDEQFRRAYREDTDLAFSLRKQGCRLVECDTAIVYHPPRRARWLSSVSEQSRQMYDALLYKKHPELFRQVVKRRPPLQYYAITLGYLGLPLALLANNWLLASLLAGAVLALEAEFITRRLRGTSKRADHVLEMIISSLVIPPIAIYWRLRGAWLFRVPFF